MTTSREAHSVLRECEGPVPPPACAVCTDNAGCSLGFTAVRCWSARCLYPLPRAPSVPTRGTVLSCSRLVVAWVGVACTSSVGVVCTEPSGRLPSSCLIARGLYPRSSRVISTNTVGRSFSFTVAGCWSAGAGTPFRASRLYRPVGRSFQPRFVCEGHVPPFSVEVGCTDPARHSVCSTARTRSVL